VISGETNYWRGRGTFARAPSEVFRNLCRSFFGPHSSASGRRMQLAGGVPALRSRFFLLANGRLLSYRRSWRPGAAPGNLHFQGKGARAAAATSSAAGKSLYAWTISGVYTKGPGYAAPINYNGAPFPVRGLERLGRAARTFRLALFTTTGRLPPRVGDIRRGRKEGSDGWQQVVHHAIVLALRPTPFACRRPDAVLPRHHALEALSGGNGSGTGRERGRNGAETGQKRGRKSSASKRESWKFIES
jgi:hypothetical protein